MLKEMAGISLLGVIAVVLVVTSILLISFFKYLNKRFDKFGKWISDKAFTVAFAYQVMNPYKKGPR